MIIWIIVGLSLLLIGTLTLIKTTWLRWSSSTLLIIALLASVSVVVANTAYHWGLRVQTTTATRRIYSAGASQSPAGMLVKKEIGTNSNRYVFVYKDKATAKKATAHFVPDTDDTVNAVKQHATYQQKSVTKATVKTTTKRWVWQSKTARWWLNVGKAPNRLISKQHVVTVPSKTWLVLTTTQAKQLAAQQKKLTTEQQQHLAKTIKVQLQAKLAVYLKQHPQATRTQQQHFVKQQTAELTVKQLKGLLN